MEFVELTQYLSKVNRAIYVQPKLIPSHRNLLKDYLTIVTGIMKSNSDTELPLAPLSDLANAQERFRFTHREYIQAFGQRVRDLLKDV